MGVLHVVAAILHKRNAIKETILIYASGGPNPECGNY